MNFIDRLKNGWKIGWTSLEIIKENPALLVFVLMSGGAMLLVLASFFSTLYFAGGASGLQQLGAWLAEAEISEQLVLIVLFLFYLIAFFIIVFFNVGLVYCARQVFEGEPVSIREGLQYSVSRVNVILPWAALAATVGVILRSLEERLGFVGQIVIGLVGAVWSIATFFVVPVLAYEDIGPIDAVKRSAAIMREKWGEAIGVNFSFGAFYLIGYLAGLATGMSMFQLHWAAGIGAGLLVIMLVHTVVSAAKTVFIAASYQHLFGEPAGHFDDTDVLDRIFAPKHR